MAGKFDPPDRLPVNLYHNRPGMPFETAEPIYYEDAIVFVTIPDRFRCDFASTPRAIWWLWPPIGLYSRAALVHDALYRAGMVGRRVADALFYEIMRDDGVPLWTRWPMYRAVRCFGWLHHRRLKSEPSRCLVEHKSFADGGPGGMIA